MECSCLPADIKENIERGKITSEVASAGYEVKRGGEIVLSIDYRKFYML